jgi:chromosome segregation ATPase
LERREKELAHRVSGLEEKAQAVDEKLAAARRDLKALAELGISLDELPGLVNRLAGIAQRHGIGSGELRDRLLNELEVLEAGLGLESSLESKREDLDEIECAIETARQEREALEHALQQLGDQQTALRKSISEEEKHIREEMEAITGIATGAVEKLVQDLGASVADAQLEMEKLRDASIELGQEMGKTEATIQANEWIRDLFALVNRDGTADASRIRVVTLSLMRSVNSWLDENQKDIEVPFWFRTQVNSMIRELVQWQV